MNNEMTRNPAQTKERIVMALPNSYKIVDTAHWKRKLHCEIFRNAFQPHFSVCLELDITHFLKRVKENKWPFSLAFIHTVTKCANEIEEFRYRFLNGDVVLYETIHTSFTYLNADTELFKVLNVPMTENIEEYIKVAKETIENQKEYITGPVPNDVYQFSSLPWIKFTNLTHTYAGPSEKSNPMFDWGKFFERDGKVWVPFAVQVHHSFVDGFHVGKLTTKLQEYLDRFPAI
jgi:chloramphenicol O-acetyltransferase type B